MSPTPASSSSTASMAWRWARRTSSAPPQSLNKPVIFAINQLDGEKADYDNVMEQMREIFGTKVVPIQYPLQCGPGFNAMIDVLLMKKYSWGPDGGVPTIEEIPAEEMDRANELHKALVEAAAENDETLMEKFFEEEHLTEDEMRMGIRKGLIDRRIFPVFCVSAAKDMGVRRMMEFLGNVVPFVEDMPAPVDTAGDAVATQGRRPSQRLYVQDHGRAPHRRSQLLQGDERHPARRRRPRQRDPRQQGASRPDILRVRPDQDSRRRPRGRRHRRCREAQGCAHRQHPRREGLRHRVRLHQISRAQISARHPPRHRERRREAQRHPHPHARGRPHMGHRAVEGAQADHTQRPGRIPPAHTQMARREQRQAPHRLRGTQDTLSRDHHQGRTRRLPPQEAERRRRPVWRGAPHHRALHRRHARARHLQVRQPGVQDERARHPGDTSRMGRQARGVQLHRGRRHRRPLHPRHRQGPHGPHGAGSPHRQLCPRRARHASTTARCTP